VKAIIFDLDGTLYQQGRLRRAMLLRLLRAHVLHPVQGVRTMRLLAAYRQTQEVLRQAAGAEPTDLNALQIALTCERAGEPQERVVECAERWMDREPLAYLSRYQQPGLAACLSAAARSGVKLAVLSDYPAEAKLRAMGLLEVFDVVRCAQSPEIGVFKPHPRGLEVTMQLMGVVPSECLYVGDRADVDGAAAAAAGIACFIVGRDGDFDALREMIASEVESTQPVLDPA